MLRTSVTALTAAVVVLASTAGARADVIQVGTSGDNTLYDDEFGITSNGSGQHFFAGVTGTNKIRRGLVRFDVSGVIPAGSIVNSVTLTLHMSQSIAGDVDIALHRALAMWGEGSSDATGGEGGGAPAEPGDATWVHTSYDDMFWTNPGGDFDATASAVTAVGAEGQFYSWTSAQLAADVQGWVDAPSESFGWLLKSDESAPATAKRFDSRENPDAALRPVLEIDFTPIPAPGALALLLAAGAGHRRRRRS